MLKHLPPPALAPGSTLVDTHCHLDMADYQHNLEEVLAAARSCGVTRIITIGTDIPSSRRAVELAGRHQGVYAAVGIHPHAADQTTEAALRELADLAASPKVVGIGETGLDYAKEYAPKARQLESFAAHLELAKGLRLPVIIHNREAQADTLRLLRRHGPLPAGGVLHCFTGDSALACQALDAGLHLSVPGIVTFANAAMLRQIVAVLPDNCLLLESDGPYLAPVPFRGQCNQPAYVLYTAAAIAALREVPLEVLAQQTTANAEALFRL